MKEVKNCKRCGKLFTTVYESEYCIRCESEDESFFRLIKEYLYENPGTSAIQLSEIFKIDVHRIYKYVKDGRLKPVCAAGANLET